MICVCLFSNKKIHHNLFTGGQGDIQDKRTWRKTSQEVSYIYPFFFFKYSLCIYKFLWKPYFDLQPDMEWDMAFKLLLQTMQLWAVCQAVPQYGNGYCHGKGIKSLLIFKKQKNLYFLFIVINLCVHLMTWSFLFTCRKLTWIGSFIWTLMNWYIQLALVNTLLESFCQMSLKMLIWLCFQIM